MTQEGKADAAAHQPSKKELEEDVSIDATPEALAWAVTRGGAERRQEDSVPQFVAHDAVAADALRVRHGRLVMNGVGENDGLSLEDKLLYGNPLRQVDVSDFVSDTAINRFTRFHEGHSLE